MDGVRNPRPRKGAHAMSNTLTHAFSSDASALQVTDLFSLGAAPNLSSLPSASAESTPPFAEMLVANEAADAALLTDAAPAPVPVQEPTASANPPPLLTLTFHPRLIAPLNAAKLADVPTEALPSESSGRSIGRETNEARCESLPDAAPAEENSSTPTEDQTENAGQILALLQQGIVIIDYVFRAPPIAPAASAETFLAANSAAAPASEPSQAPLSAHGLESRNLFANSTMRPAQNSAVRPEKLATTAAPLTGPSLIDASQSTPPEAVSVFPSTSAASLAAPSAPRVLLLAAQPLSPRPLPITTESVRVDSPVTLQLSPQATAQLAAASLSSSVSAPVASASPQAFAVAQANLAGIPALGLSPERGKEFTPVMRSDKKSLLPGSKIVTSSPEVVGTSAANPRFSMLNSTQDYAITTNPFSTVTNFASTLERTWNPESFAAEAPAPALASQAVHVVREIRDIADGLWATERNSVELRFNFEGHDQLSVRVEYRDGDVRATFRTNSPELRDALAGEWHTQQSQQGHYTMLAPVFENGPAPTSRSGFFSNENFSRDQQNAREFSQHARDEDRPRGQNPQAFFHGEAETPTRATPHLPPSARHPSARLLHAQA